jgi:hypothetical protein
MKKGFIVFVILGFWGIAGSCDCGDLMRSTIERVSEALKYDPDRFFILSHTIPPTRYPHAHIEVRDIHAADRLRAKLSLIDPEIDIVAILPANETSESASPALWSIHEVVIISETLQRILNESSDDTIVRALVKADANAFFVRKLQTGLDVFLTNEPMQASDFEVFEAQVRERAAKAVEIYGVEYDKATHVGWLRLKGSVSALRELLSAPFSFLVDATYLKEPPVDADQRR